jgi:transcriptional regulator with XRE-family HTH domain
MKKVKDTFGAMLRKVRLTQRLSLRAAAAKAGISPMYLSLLERDACGPPSDEKLQSLAEVLGEQHVETLFAKAGRVTPQVAKTILRHPTEWSELIEAGKNLDCKGINALTEAIFWARARAQVRATEAFLDKEMAPEKRTKDAIFSTRKRELIRSVEAFVNEGIDLGKRTTEEKKGKKKGRKVSDWALTVVGHDCS